jgi:integrase
MAFKAALKLVPNDEKPTIATPRRKPNKELRPREYLTEAEIDRLVAAVKVGRYGHRDATMVRLAYQHGLRVGELINLEWPQFDLEAARFHVRRLKGSEDSVHPLTGREVRDLRRLKREAPAGSRFVFTSMRVAAR